MSSIKGTPTLLPISGLAATTFNPVLLLTGSIYQSNLDFISSIARNSNSPVETLFGSAVSLLGGGESNDYAGASAKILAAELDNLHAVLSLTFPLKIGDSFPLTALVSGCVTPELDARNNDVDAAAFGLMAGSLALLVPISRKRAA